MSFLLLYHKKLYEVLDRLEQDFICTCFIMATNSILNLKKNPPHRIAVIVLFVLLSPLYTLVYHTKVYKVQLKIIHFLCMFLLMTSRSCYKLSIFGGKWCIALFIWFSRFFVVLLPIGGTHSDGKSLTYNKEGLHTGCTQNISKKNTN